MLTLGYCADGALRTLEQRRVALSLLAVLSFLASSASASLEDHKNIIYSVPIPGMERETDCYANSFFQEIDRDMRAIIDLGTTTVITTNHWKHNQDHSAFLQLLAGANISLGITVFPAVNLAVRKDIVEIQGELGKHGITWSALFIDYEVDFDRAEEFFGFVGKMRTWMDQVGVDAPLVVRFFRGITSTAQIEALLQSWDWAAFDAWAVPVYSQEHMKQWIRFAANKQKKIFFFYGADSIHLAPTDGKATRRSAESEAANSSAKAMAMAVRADKFIEAELDQSLQIENLWTYITGPMLEYEQQQKGVPADSPGTAPGVDPNSTAPSPSKSTRDTSWRSSDRVVIATALLGFADELYLGEDEDNIQGSSTDVCPDTNPYLQTTCGVRDADVVFGDTVVSVEHMGLFRSSETLTFDRCVHYKAAASMVRQLWTGDTETSYPENAMHCRFVLSIFPTNLVYLNFIFLGGALLVYAGIAISTCSCKSCRRVPAGMCVTDEEVGHLLDDYFNLDVEAPPPTR